MERLLGWARKSGAQAIVVCCPLCQSNLDLLGAELSERSQRSMAVPALPILYYTELLALAFGLKSVRKGLRSHLVDPGPLLRKFGLQHRDSFGDQPSPEEGVQHA